MWSIGGNIMFFERNLLATVTVCLGVALAACSSDAKDDGEKNTSGPVAACEHVNDVCMDTKGFQKQDCSTSDADYAKLNAQDKKQADGMIPCILSSQLCEQALSCIYPNATSDKNASANDKKSSDTTEDACNHINSVCKGEQGFETQDCSHSNDDYQNLSASDQQLADDIVPCVMGADDCETAFKCLKVQQQQQ